MHPGPSDPDDLDKVFLGWQAELEVSSPEAKVEERPQRVGHAASSLTRGE
jgi:hypothetical protein